MIFLTDENNNPTAFTIYVAAEAGLKIGVDYEQGTPWKLNGYQFYTAKLLGDPVQVTVRVIDAVGFYTINGLLRWSYIGIPETIWMNLSPTQKLYVIGWMYQREGGTALHNLFIQPLNLSLAESMLFGDNED